MTKKWWPAGLTATPARRKWHAIAFRVVAAKAYYFYLVHRLIVSTSSFAFCDYRFDGYPGEAQMAQAVRGSAALDDEPAGGEDVPGVPTEAWVRVSRGIPPTDPFNPGARRAAMYFMSVCMFVPCFHLQLLQPGCAARFTCIMGVCRMWRVLQRAP